FLIILPIFVTADSVLSTSLFGKSLIESWDVSVMAELLTLKSEALPAIILTIFAGGVIYLTLMQFINGGLYYLTVSRKMNKINWRDFAAEGFSGFSMNIKITLIMLIVYALLIPAGMFFVSLIGLMGGQLGGDSAAFLMILNLLIMMAILTAASIFSDSARAASAAYPDKGLRDILRHGADFFKPRLGRLFLYFVLTYFPFFIIWLLVEWLALKSTGGVGGTIGIIVEFLLFQLASISRTGQKLWYLVILGREYHSADPGRFIPEQTELEF
ncbi:MAG: hypothetical protein AB1746_14890, partial [Candidatus Zixiibacteriota bacterium]